jgi:DNA repair protein RecO (recombination protein O)
MRVELQSVFVLHSRPFRDTSLIVDCLTPDHGRISLLAKGARSAKSRQRRILQPFIPLCVSWQGKSELKTLTQAETVGQAIALQGQALFSGLYLNELLTRLLRQHDPHPEVLELYSVALTRLSSENNIEPVLRLFECELLTYLGYEINFNYEITRGQAIAPDLYYEFLPEQGFRVLENTVDQVGSGMYRGDWLSAIAQGCYDAPLVLRAAKSLMRQALKPHLGGKPLQSRALFQNYSKSTIS